MPVLDDTDPRPAYVQIADDLRASIASGELAPPARLPSQRDLAERYGVAPETLRRAVDILAREGLVSAGSTRGTFILRTPEDAPDIPSELAELRERIEEVSGQADDGPLRERVGAIEAALIDLYGKMGFEYPGHAPARPERKAARA